MGVPPGPSTRPARKAQPGDDRDRSSGLTSSRDAFTGASVVRSRLADFDRHLASRCDPEDSELAVVIGRLHDQSRRDCPVMVALATVGPLRRRTTNRSGVRRG